MKVTGSQIGFYCLLLVTVVIVAIAQGVHARQKLVVPFVALFPEKLPLLKTTPAWLDDKPVSVTLEHFAMLFQPLLLFRGPPSDLAVVLSDPQKTPPVNLNIDGNWDFDDTPANVRVKMYHRSDNFVPFYGKGGTVYYHVARFPPPGGEDRSFAPPNLLSHQYWYYFPVGAGEFIGTSDQRFVLVEIVQNLTPRGLWGRRLHESDISFDGIYITGPMNLSDSLARERTIRYTPDSVLFRRFRPIIAVNASTHEFEPFDGQGEPVEYKINKGGWIAHPQGRELLVSTDHHRDWNNPRQRRGECPQASR